MKLLSKYDYKYFMPDLRVCEENLEHVGKGKTISRNVR